MCYNFSVSDHPLSRSIEGGGTSAKLPKMRLLLLPLNCEAISAVFHKIKFILFLFNKFKYSHNQMEQERINIACHSQNNGKSMIQGIFPESSFSYNDCT